MWAVFTSNLRARITNTPVLFEQEIYTFVKGCYIDWHMDRRTDGHTKVVSDIDTGQKYVHLMESPNPPSGLNKGFGKNLNFDAPQ